LSKLTPCVAWSGFMHTGHGVHAQTFITATLGLKVDEDNYFHPELNQHGRRDGGAAETGGYARLRRGQSDRRADSLTRGAARQGGARQKSKHRLEEMQLKYATSR